VDDDRHTTHREAPQRIVTGDDPRRLRAVIVLLVAVIVVLVLRPWGDSGASHQSAPGASTRPAVGVAAASGAPGTGAKARPTAASMAPETAPGGASGREVSCGAPDGWRATTVQVWPDRVLPVRSWIAIDPVEAGGPQDRSIPLAPVAANRITLIGYCAPLAARLQPPAGSIVTLWSLVSSEPTELTQISVDPTTLYRQGVLWRPAPELAAIPREGGTTAWPPGRYVIEIADPERTFDRWLGLEILDLGRGLTPGSSPNASPGSALTGSAPR
jgi:hypothetical protein